MNLPAIRTRTAKIQPSRMKTEAKPTKNQPRSAGGGPFEGPNFCGAKIEINPRTKWMIGKQANNAANPLTT